MPRDLSYRKLNTSENILFYIIILYTFQSSGVFSEGISAASRARRGGAGGGQSSGGSDREPRAALERPKLNLNQVIDKADEEEKVKQLLRDDFIDDGTDADIENAPIALPLIDEGLF